MSPGPIRKAVIPAAGYATRQYPASASVPKGLFPVVDLDGLTKPVLQLAVEEAVRSGIEEIAIVSHPDDEACYRKAFSGLPASHKKAFASRPGALEQSDYLASLGERITFVYQNEPRGYGHAVWCAADWTGDEPFLVMLGDHVFISHGDVPCARQLLDAFAALQKSVSGLHRLGPDDLCGFGIVRAKPLETYPRGYAFEEITEKPSPEHAAQHFRIPGLPPDTYLGWFGLHAVTTRIMECLAKRAATEPDAEIGFTEAQRDLMLLEGFCGLEIDGAVYDTGQAGKYLETQIRLGLLGPYREGLHSIFDIR